MYFTEVVFFSILESKSLLWYVYIKIYSFCLLTKNIKKRKMFIYSLIQKLVTLQSCVFHRLFSKFCVMYLEFLVF